MKPSALVVLVALAVAACGRPTPAATPTSTTPPTTSVPTTPSVDNVAAIRETFDAFVAASGAKDSAKALPLLATVTFADFYKLREHALTSTEPQLGALPPGRHLFVYALRGMVDLAVLRAGSATDVTRFLLDKGLINVSTSSKTVSADGTTTVKATTPVLENVTVDGDKATGEMSSNDKAAPVSGKKLTLAFVREHGEWKIDITPILDFSTVVLEEVAAKKGVSVDQVITESLVAQFGAARTAELRKPLNG